MRVGPNIFPVEKTSYERPREPRCFDMRLSSRAPKNSRYSRRAIGGSIVITVATAGTARSSDAVGYSSGRS